MPLDLKGHFKEKIEVEREKERVRPLGQGYIPGLARNRPPDSPFWAPGFRVIDPGIGP